MSSPELAQKGDRIVDKYCVFKWCLFTDALHGETYLDCTGKRQHGGRIMSFIVPLGMRTGMIRDDRT